MRILKPTILGLKNLEVKEQTKETKERKTHQNKLPSNEYGPLFPPTRFLVREEGKLKQYLEISIKRSDEGIENPPTVYIQMYQESEFYTGYLKGKNVSFPVKSIYEVLMNLNDIVAMCEDNKYL